MKDPDIIRHSISATNFALSSLGFNNEAYHTYSSPVANNATSEMSKVPDAETMIQGAYKYKNIAFLFMVLIIIQKYEW